METLLRNIDPIVQGILFGLAGGAFVGIFLLAVLNMVFGREK